MKKKLYLDVICITYKTTYLTLRFSYADICATG